ncbi:hypothetical protein P3X46_033835 [Hevea brasiliensis]|uniref:BHLH domain-containing protein n=1 Tax=Hevea brasiliensis TaxID=3981 RepID=A0ABQ9KCJ6_HEVBR|nr:transcription factor bHLH112 [Hevea brasiliensis]XP_057997872.1 transcription factor bHLH112-like [Hevea brasiliensis]KAJ9129072.1 hypothetical protein P3X46_034165 [Hevea brasiliensis]KAJ9129421.1 hypothetical protein P3X46_033835 [Hevea brasiliensis]
MAEEFQTGICGGNWCSLSTSVFMGGSSPCSTGINANDMGTYGSWMEPRSCKLDSNNISNNSNSLSEGSVILQDSQKPQQTDSDSAGSSILMDSTLQMMGFGLSSSSSSSSDWSQTLLRGNGRAENYNSILQEEMNSSGINTCSQIRKDWSPKSFTSTGEDSAINAFKAINQDFSLEQQRLNPLSSPGNSTAATCQGLSTGFSMGSASYGYPSALIQSLFDPDPQPQQSLFNNRNMNYSSPSNYGNILNELSPSWPKLAPFLKPSLPKQQQLPAGGLHFSNNTPFWNASATALNDIGASFIPSSQPQFLVPTFDEKPSCPNFNPKTNNEEVRDSGSVVKKGSEPAFKRPRIETPSPLPTFKVRKEKLGDRITALQQLVSPFGKTDTASVLHEAIEYIKFLHDQVSVLSTPYMKNGSPIQHHQGAENLNDPEGSKDLKSRGLCLVPISSTFPVANETTADFWTPTFGGTFR